ncbi:sensor domain-containing diguanylate cyclase [Paenibacillus sp. CAA11]|uniref:sensor domain-containing diguanylate cyclase n=1 Tax=Paenibacillus sp. CAA11 TaxID=1532905 RepID=UPI00131F1AF3|nr:sensor domain-containing diguanylate cyclase [Paenibacillus sp. CAA11]
MLRNLKSKGLTLRSIISSLVICSVLITIILGLISAYSANKASLTETYLISNNQYAKKLSSDTSNLLVSMEEKIGYIANIIKRDGHINSVLLGDIFAENRQYFNSIFWADASRVIKSISPQTTGAHVGDRLQSTASIQAVKQKKMLISEPYVSRTGRLIILVSAPVYSQQGKYQGFVGGTIYLQEKNAISSTLEEHFFGNGSYVYVTDSSGKLIYHPKKSRLYQSVLANEVIQKAVHGQSGAQIVKNSKGIEYLAGYAYEQKSRWAIVAQTPASLLDKPLEKLRNRMLFQCLIFLGVILFVGWQIARWIAKPIQQLAEYTVEATDRGTDRRPMPELGSKTYEIRLLYRSFETAFHAIDSYIGQLQTEVQIDGLTGIPNRRSFDQMMEALITGTRPFSLILLDIDHFKQINDSYGHLQGDNVLQRLADFMSQQTREGYFCYRYGGEEFAIILADTSSKDAYDFADDLRQQIERLNSSSISITVSMGIASYPANATDIEALVHQADQALYISKNKGRNQVTLYQRNP